MQDANEPTSIDSALSSFLEFYRQYNGLIYFLVLQYVPGEEFAEDMIPEQTVLYVRVLENGQMISENHYFYAPYGKLQLQKANITCKIKKMNDGQAELTLCADTFVWLLHLKAQDNVEFADNDFVLLPGVSRKVILTGENAPKLPEFVCLNPCV